MRTGIVLVGLLTAMVASAQENGPTAQRVAQRVDLDSVTALVVTLASCAALHSAAAEMLEHELPDHAETARRRAQADQYTAMYLLAEDRVAKGGAPRALTSYTSYVEQLTAAGLERMTAILTKGDVAAFQKEEDLCSSLIALEDEALAKIGAE